MKKSTLRLIYSCLVLIFIIILACFTVVPFLSENQTLYLSSTLAQVCATLFGLTIAAYTFLEGKLTEDVKVNATLLDSVNELKSSYKYILSFDALITGLALLLCIVNIIVGDYSKHITSKFYGFVLNNSFVFSFFSITCSLYFTYKAIDPNRIKKASQNGLKNSKFTLNTNNKETGKNCAIDFLTNYNNFEHILYSFVRDKKPDIESPMLQESLHFLRNSGVINNELFTQLCEIKKFRNLLIHSDDMFVNESTFNILKELMKETEKALTNYKNNS